MLSPILIRPQLWSIIWKHNSSAIFGPPTWRNISFTSARCTVHSLAGHAPRASRFVPHRSVGSNSSCPFVIHFYCLVVFFLLLSLCHTMFYSCFWLGTYSLLFPIFFRSVFWLKKRLGMAQREKKIMQTNESIELVMDIVNRVWYCAHGMCGVYREWLCVVPVMDMFRNRRVRSVR